MPTPALTLNKQQRCLMSRNKLERLEGRNAELMRQRDEAMQRASNYADVISKAEAHRNSAETKATALQRSVDQLKYLLHEAECEKAKLFGMLARVHEVENDAARPQVKTTQETVSRQGPAIRPPVWSAGEIGCDPALVRMNDSKHWTSF